MTIPATRGLGARLVSGAVLALALAFPGPADAERPLPDWDRWESSRSIRRGEAALVRGDLVEAENQARRATTLTPGEPITWSLLCRVHTAAGAWEDLGLAAGQWTNLDEHSVSAALMAGRAAVETGRGERARTQFQRVSSLAPDAPDGPLGLGLCAARLDQDWSALQGHLREARRRAPRVDLATLPLQPAWAPLAEEPAFLEAINEVLRDEPPSDPPSESPHAENDAGAPDK